MVKERGLYKLTFLKKESEYTLPNCTELMRTSLLYLSVRNNAAQTSSSGLRSPRKQRVISWSSLTAKIRDTIDDDSKTALEIWDELARLRTTTSTQAILNLKQEPIG